MTETDKELILYELEETLYLLKLIQRDWFREHDVYNGYKRYDIRKQISNLYNVIDYFGTLETVNGKDN